MPGLSWSRERSSLPFRAYLAPTPLSGADKCLMPSSLPGWETRDHVTLDNTANKHHFGISPGSWVSLCLYEWTKVAQGSRSYPLVISPLLGRVPGWLQRHCGLSRHGKVRRAEGWQLSRVPSPVLPGAVCVTPTPSSVCASVFPQWPPPAVCQPAEGQARCLLQR